MAGPFTREDLDEVVAMVVAAWRSGLDGDWSAPAVMPVGARPPTDDPWSDVLEGTGRPRA